MAQKQSTFAAEHYKVSAPNDLAEKVYPATPGKRHQIQGGIVYGYTHDPAGGDGYLQITAGGVIVAFQVIATAGPHFFPLPDSVTKAGQELKITLGNGGVFTGENGGAAGIIGSFNVVGHQLIA